MTKHPRHKAFSILSQILWERRFIKKRKHYAVVSGGRMVDKEWVDLKNKLDKEYEIRLNEYNDKVRELEMQRQKFYEENLGFPIKTMYMNVCAPPQRISINFID